MKALKGLIILGLLCVVPALRAADTRANSALPAPDGAQGENLAQQLHLERKGDGTDWMADVASRLQLHGYAQGWYSFQHADGKNSNTFLCKRVLFWANAQITPRWSFLFMHDFCSVVQEYYTDFRITNNRLLTVRLGQSKTGLTYENPLSPTAMECIDVYSEGVTYLAGCGSDPLNGVNYGRDQGLFFFGETDNRLLRYEVELVNGSGLNAKDKDNVKNVIGRIEVRPIEGLNLCATGQIGRGTALVDCPVFNPELTAGSLYRRDRVSAGAAYQSKRVNLHGEYLQGWDGSVTSLGGYLTGSVALIPSTLDVVASYDYFNFNTAQAMDMHKAVVGLQYWFFKKCRVQVQYVYKNAQTDYATVFRRGDVHQVLCQMQVRFN